MTIAIMQPYFFPYIGYWQLMNYVDQFVVYDNIQYTKKGWINRNRYLLDGKPAYFTVPIVGASDYDDICDRNVADIFWKGKIKNQLSAAYKKAPYYDVVENLVTRTILEKKENLFDFLYASIKNVAEALDISTSLIVSSEISNDRSKKGEDRVVDICKMLNANEYINPIGGVELYYSKHFLDNGIELKFLKSRLTAYKQYENEFIPSLSIIDVLAFNGIEGTKMLLNDFELVTQDIK